MTSADAAEARTAAAMERAERIGRLDAALVAALTVEEVTAVLADHVAAALDCQTFQFDAQQRLFLTTVADLAAQALERAMRGERVRADARRHRLLADAQKVINRRLDPAAQLSALSRVVVPELADFSSVHVLHRPVPAGVMPELPVITDRVASAIIPGVEGPPVQGGYVWSGGDPITETIRQGRLLTQPQSTPVVPDWAGEAGIAATFRGGLHHLVQAPVTVGGMVVAVASFGMCHDRPAWDADDLAIIEEIAGYAAVALEHGLSYQRARETAVVSAWRAALVHGLQDGLFVIDATGEVVEVNDAFTAMLGYGPEGLPYSSPYPWWPDPQEDPAGHAQLQAAFAEAITTGHARYLLPLRHRDGHQVWTDCAEHTVPDRDGSGPLTVGVARDVTAQHRAAERAEQLAKVAEALAAAASVEDLAVVLGTHVQQAVSCDQFTLRVVDLEARTARAVHLKGAPLGFRQQFIDGALDEPSALAEAVATHQPVFVSSTQDNQRRYGPSARLHYTASGIEAMAKLPLLVEGELIAILGIGYHRAREIDAELRLFLTTVADLAAQALARAMRTERVRADARRHRLVSAAQATINRRMDPGEQLRALSASVVPELADFSSVHVLAHPVPPGVMPALPVITDRVSSHIIPGVVAAPLLTGLAWYEGDPITETIRQGRLLTDRIATPAVPEWATRTGTGATFSTGLNHVVLAPVVVDGLVVAVASFGMCHDRALWDDEDLEIIEQIAGYAAIALEHGLTYQQTRATALTLQRSLLTRPPTVPGLEIAARYHPAGHDEVGGDWYDVFEVGPDQLAIVIGDVVGHDITAAAAMGQLRVALRTLSVDGHNGPAATLDRLGALNQQLEITRLATVVHGLLVPTGAGPDQTGWRLRWSNAGHPPPVLLAPDGTARLLEAAHGVALTRRPGPSRSDAEITLEPGSTLLLYTDGLVEARGTHIQENIEALRARAGGCAARSTEDLCDELLRGTSNADDIALLAIRVNLPPDA